MSLLLIVNERERPPSKEIFATASPCPYSTSGDRAPLRAPLHAGLAELVRLALWPDHRLDTAQTLNRRASTYEPVESGDRALACNVDHNQANIMLLSGLETVPSGPKNRTQ